MGCLLLLAAVGQAPGRLVLEGVPRVGYDLRPCPFPGSLCAALEYLGEPVDYDRLMGVTGACFRRFWNRDDGGNIDLGYLAPEPFERAARLIGRELRAVPWGDEAVLRAAIRDSLARGLPVLAFGIVGPPEAGLIGGCDRDGEVLLGWSYFQEEPRDRYFERDDWYARADQHGPQALLILGEPTTPAAFDAALLRETLIWALDLARTERRPGRPDHIAGLAAYDAWAAGLEVDADYVGDAKLLYERAMIHGDQCAMLAEREVAARFLRRAAALVPVAAEPLELAADRYAAAGALTASLWPWPGGFESPAVQAGLADPTTRRRLAAIIRRAAAFEAEGVDLLDDALGCLEP